MHDQVEQQRKLVLTLESEQQEGIVMILLAALYGMDPPTTSCHMRSCSS